MTPLRIVVDANIILSALLGGTPSSVLFDGRFRFITTEYTIREVRKYIPKFALTLESLRGDSKNSLISCP